MSQSLTLPVRIGLTLIGGASLFGLWEFQKSLIGSPPTKAFRPEVAMSEGNKGNPHEVAKEYSDPDIQRLRDATKVRPKERLVWISLARELMHKAQEGVANRQQASVEAIQALRKVLELNDKDREAILMMGDISFDMQVFQKAADFYEQYLKIEANDDSTRTRYASALTFLGRGEEARVILEEVIGRNPVDFQALAFLALTFAQLGEVEKVKFYAEKAIQAAPHEEARERLKSFLSATLQASEENGGTPQTKSTGTQVNTTAAEPSPIRQSAVTLGQFLAQNPVAGPKIRDFQLDGSELVIFVEEFPMSAMPTFAKEKFFGSIQEFVKKNSIKYIAALRFEDVNSGRIEGRLSLTEENTE